MPKAPFTSVVLSFLVVFSVCLQTAFAQQTTENSWEKTSAMPKPDSDFRAVAVGDKIYVFSYNYTYLYDTQTGTWTQKKLMPTPRISYAIAAAENKVYIIGGNDGSPSSANEAYDTATDTWETKQPLSQPRSGIDANVVDGKIYVIGGATSDGSNLNEVYDPVTDTWTNKTGMPAGSCYYYISAAIDEKIYFMSSLGITQIYDTRTDIWTTGAPIPMTLSDPGIAVTTGQNAPKRIYVMGGMKVIDIGTWDISNHTYMYDPVLDSWSKAADMPTARGRFAVAVLNDKIYTIGGVVGLFNATDVVEVYTPFGYVAPTPTPMLTPTVSAPASPSVEPTPTATPTQSADNKQEVELYVLAASAGAVVVAAAVVAVQVSRRRKQP